MAATSPSSSPADLQAGEPESGDSLFDQAAPWTLVIVTARDDIKARCDRAVEWS